MLTRFRFSETFMGLRGAAPRLAAGQRVNGFTSLPPAGLRIRFGRTPRLVLAAGGLLVMSGLAHAQALVTLQDTFGVPFGMPLVVESPGVLENDTLDGEPAGDLIPDMTVELVGDVSKGTLSCPADASFALCPDGSFDYTPGPAFDGTDSFSYQASYPPLGAVSGPTTVTLSACEPTADPLVFQCWQEAPFLAKLKQLGYTPFREGFEGAAWDAARNPANVASLDNQGITWTSNHPATNFITTGSGAARTGAYGIYDDDHGYVPPDLTTTICNVDTPPPECFFHDGVTGTVPPGGRALHAVGAYVKGGAGYNLAIFLDEMPVPDGGITFAKSPTGSFSFFGVIDSSPAGFSKFKFLERDSKLGNQYVIFLDDFTMARSKTLFYFNAIQGAL